MFCYFLVYVLLEENGPNYFLTERIFVIRYAEIVYYYITVVVDDVQCV